MDEHGGHLAFELDIAAGIGDRVRKFFRRSSRGAQYIFGRLRTVQNPLRFDDSQGFRAGGPDRDPGAADRTVRGQRQLHGRRRGSEVADFAFDFLIRTRRLLAGYRKTDFEGDLTFGQGGCKRIDEKLVDGNHAFAGLAAYDDLGAAGQRDNAPITGRIVVAKAADDGAALTHDWIGNDRRRIGDQAIPSFDLR